MASRYECSWCGQTIKKTMCCGSILGTENCFWVPLVREVGVMEALRRGKREPEAFSYERAPNQPTSTLENNNG